MLVIANVPGIEHDGLVELFRNRPDLATTLLELCTDLRFENVTVELGSNDLTQVMPATFLSDSVHVVRDAAREVVAGIIVEVQRDRDPDKRFTWPVYVAGLRARLRAPVVLVVLVTNHALAGWCREPIHFGLDTRSTLFPIVIELADIPRITEVAAASRSAELAMLSTLGHPEPAVVRALVAEMATIPSRNAVVYLELLRLFIPTLETDMQTLEQLKQRVDKELKDSWDEGHEEGLEKGRAAAGSELALKAARAKLGQLSPALEQRIAEYADPEGLIVAFVTAPDADATRAVLVQRGLLER